MEAKNGGSICVKSCQEPSETLLEPGCRAMRFSEERFGHPRNLENRAPATMRAQFLLISRTTPGGSKIDPNLVQNRGQMASGGVQVASKVVSKKGAISVLIFGPDFHEFPGPGGILDRISSPRGTIFERILACIFDPPALHFGTSAVTSVRHVCSLCFLMQNNRASNQRKQAKQASKVTQIHKSRQRRGHASVPPQ